MRKVFIQCECGQRMQVARSAMGKVGMCPTCGRKMRISEGNTQPLPDREGGNNAAGRRPFWRNNRWGRQDGPAREEAKRLFGRAADLFCNGQYGEAMALFDELVERFPGNPEIENAREQCLQARLRQPIGLPHHGGTSGAGGTTDREGLRQAVMEKLLDKLHRGSTDMVQLQAAELIARMQGFLDGRHEETPAETGNPPSSPEESTSQQQPSSEDGTDAEETPQEREDRATPTPPPFDPDEFEAELSSESAR